MVEIACNNTIFSNIQAVFFDKDGTLEDSRIFLQELAKERVNQIAKIATPSIIENLLLALGITKNRLDPKGLMAVGSRKENQLAAAAYIASSGYGWFEAQEIANIAFNKATKIVKPNQKSSPIFPNSSKVLKSLVQANVKLGIISADSIEGIQHFVDREHIGSYFKLILGSDRELSKPNPLMYLKACEILNVKPQNTLMVGDSFGDIQMAKQANAGGTIGICWGNSQAKYLAEATVVIDSLKAIKIL